MRERDLTVRAKDLSYASIVRATVSDQNGRNFKHRSLVIVDQSPTFDPDAALALACITSCFNDDPQYVPLPFLADSLHGHPATGLRVACAVACQWLRTLDSYAIDEVRGYVPESAMDRILGQIRRLNARVLSDPNALITAATIRAQGQTSRG